MKAIRDEMNSVHGVAADRMRAYHDRWILLHRAAATAEGIAKKPYTDEANRIRDRLKNWLNKREDSLSRGGWICPRCHWMPDWKKSVDGIEKVDPDNIVVKRLGEGLVSTVKHKMGTRDWKKD